MKPSMVWTRPPRRYGTPAEDTPSGAVPDNVEKTPVFDRAGQAPKI
jgi:hypothetical protein